MSLSDIMGNLALDVYAQVALVLFLVAFGAIAINVLSRRPEQTRRDAALPLGDEPEYRSTPSDRAPAATGRGGGA
ncbi:MAG: hypothetical protein H6809_00435 [Phycisphaeraceae bacterium]|nr:hypothetical protein [Phycisphaeraceae bacterium]